VGFLTGAGLARQNKTNLADKIHNFAPCPIDLKKETHRIE